MYGLIQKSNNISHLIRPIKNYIFVQKCVFSKLADKIEPETPIPKIRKFRFKDLMEITKFRLSLANTSVALITYFMVSPVIDSQMLIFGLATQLIAMSSQTTNQNIEKEYDKMMIRTCNRPLPRSRIDSGKAGVLSIGLFAASNWLFYMYLPMPSLLMANFIYFSYVYIYTPLKRMSKINTFIGAISGSLPPYLGWLAAGGSFFDLMPLNIVLYMFSWQFSHFYGILWIYQEDYRKAGFVMIDNSKQASLHMKQVLLIKIISGFWVCSNLSFNPFYLYHLALGSSLYFYAYKPLLDFEKNGSINNAKKLKKSSYNHLMVFFGIILIDNIIKIMKNKLEKNELEKR